MIKEQKHSINKVILRVDTKNKKVAFQFKDNLSMFLKQEIFPYLEKYFDNLVKDVSAEIIQIEKLNLEINVTNNHDFSILKSDLKNQIKKKVDIQLSKLIKEKPTTTLISAQESNIKSFFYFLEEGILPWWNEHQSKKVFNENELLKLVKNVNFKNQFQQKIKNSTVQHRLINQFYNDELVLLCNQTFNQLKTEKKLVSVLGTTKFSLLNNKIKKSIWLLIFEYFNTKNSKDTLRKLVEFVQVKKEQKETITSELLNLEIIVLKLLTIISGKQINKLTDLNLIKYFEIPNANINKHKTAIVEEDTTIKKSIDKNKTKEDTIEKNLKPKNKDKIKGLKTQDTPKEKLITKNDKPLKIAQEKSEIKNNNEKNNVANKENRKRKEEVALSKEEIATSKEEVALNKEEIAMSKEGVALNKEEIATSKEEIALSKEEVVLSKEEIATSKEEVALSKEEIALSKEEIATSKEEIALSKEEVALNKEEIAMSKEGVATSKEESAMSKKEIVKSKEGVAMSKEEDTISNKEDNVKERQRVFKDDNNVNDKGEISYVNELNPNIELPEVITNSLLKEEETIEEIFLENPKETYYIKNAGLILIHPFLKQFFQNSNLLTEDGQLKDKELAVHLLHYIATKKENQLESNLIFEKFLCGIPIKKSIDRKIKISKKLKDQTEELLEAVIQNWEVLKNSSTDLLRFEFLQREGKLSLEKENPKITIKRKTQDILLNKISWNISICKIPWLTKLLFTDW